MDLSKFHDAFICGCIEESSQDMYLFCTIGTQAVIILGSKFIIKEAYMCLTVGMLPFTQNKLQENR